MPLHPIIPILGPPDYRDWLTLSDSFSDDQKNQQYMRDIMPYISDNTEGTPLNKALQENAWLLEFLGPESDFEAALNELRQRPNEATMILADFVKHLAGTVMAVSWQERMKDVVERFAPITEQQYMNNEEITVLRQAFEDAVPKVEDHPLWRVLRARVRTFTLSIGCPSSNNDPLDCITALRRHLSLRAWTLENTATQSNSGTQNTTQHSHDDYTACWISPMEVEQIAAMEMLDEEHERLPQPRTDQNVYTLGSIAGHNVVIAGLPLTGNNPAATVATQAMETFRNLRFCLLVGIGGAVPTATDNGLIRLGDVIVNKPAAQHSGVIQYDRGKAEDGFFQRTGALPPPPRVLLSAAQSLATKRARSSTDPIKENIKRIDIKIRGLARYQYPGLIYDHLYPSHYVHRQPGRACEDCGCDPAERLERSFGNEDDGPVITVHRGTIASGEIIMKSGTLRDSLAEQYGILCFETEAAGVSATLPCMVIRGISDYSDSHKDDRWHGYAAATAAAYAREIFFHMPLEQAQTTL